MHEVLVNRLGGLSLPRKSVVRLNDRPDMTLDVYRGRKTTIQYYSTKNHDKRDEFDLTVFFPLLDGDVPHATFYGVYIFQFSVGNLTRKSGVLGSIPGLAT